MVISCAALPDNSSLHSEYLEHRAMYVSFRQLTGQSIESRLYTLQPRSVILFQLEIILQEEGAPLPAQILARSTPEQSPDELRFFLSHFLSRRASWSLIGPRSAPTSSCGDAPFVSAIRSLATDAAASRPTMSITTGLGSDAAFARIVGRPSPCFPCSLSPTPITACWPGLRRSGDTLSSTARGKRRRPH